MSLFWINRMKRVEQTFRKKKNSESGLWLKVKWCIWMYISMNKTDVWHMNTKYDTELGSNLRLELRCALTFFISFRISREISELFFPGNASRLTRTIRPLYVPVWANNSCWLCSLCSSVMSKRLPNCETKIVRMRKNPAMSHSKTIQYTNQKKKQNQKNKIKKTKSKEETIPCWKSSRIPRN